MIYWISVPICSLRRMLGASGYGCSLCFTTTQGPENSCPGRSHVGQAGGRGCPATGVGCGPGTEPQERINPCATQTEVRGWGPLSLWPEGTSGRYRVPSMIQSKSTTYLNLFYPPSFFQLSGVSFLGSSGVTASEGERVAGEVNVWSGQVGTGKGEGWWPNLNAELDKQRLPYHGSSRMGAPFCQIFGIFMKSTHFKFLLYFPILSTGTLSNYFKANETYVCANSVPRTAISYFRTSNIQKAEFNSSVSPESSFPKYLLEPWVLPLPRKLEVGMARSYH